MNPPKDKQAASDMRLTAHAMHIHPLESEPAATDPTTATQAEIEAAFIADSADKSAPLHLPSSDELKGKWKQKVGAAKIAWGKFTHDELLEMEGHEQKMIGRVQERYALTRDEAAAQVRQFLAQQQG